jgi:hypothetical protein
MRRVVIGQRARKMGVKRKSISMLAILVRVKVCIKALLLKSMSYDFFAAPYGPYGPWSKNGPAQFISPKQDYLKKVFAHPKYPKKNGLQQHKKQPMGKMRPWPLSGENFKKLDS